MKICENLEYYFTFETIYGILILGELLYFWRLKMESLIIIKGLRSVYDSCKYCENHVNEFEKVLEIEEHSEYLQGKLDMLMELEEILSTPESIQLELEMIRESQKRIITMLAQYSIE